MAEAVQVEFDRRAFVEVAREDFARLEQQLERIDFTGQTVLMSGATGFFGAWLLAMFDAMHGRGLSAPRRVVAISRAPAAFLARHPWLRQAPWLEWITGDIRDFRFPAGQIDAVIHAATETSAEAGRNAALLFDAIISGTRRMLECASACGARRILLVSSGGVYGVQAADVTHQSESTLSAPSSLDPGSAYGEGKRAMEMLGAIFARDTGTAVMVARCFTFVGPGLPLDAHFAIGNFIRDALREPRIVIKGDGKGIRSYLYMADLAIWLGHLLGHGISGRAYNVGSDADLSIAELAQTVLATLAPGKDVVIQNLGMTSPVGSRYVPSIARAREELGLAPWTDLAHAIRTTAWCRPETL